MAQGNGYSVLMISRSLDGIEAVSAILGDAGYRVMRARCNPEAFRREGNERPDLVICELSMAGLDGREVCREVRAVPELGRVPILLVGSNQSEVSSVLGAFEAGADDYIEAPFEPVSLIGKVGCLVKVGRNLESTNERIVAERRKAEADRAELGVIVAFTADAVVNISVDGTIRSWNRGAEKLYGYSAEEAVGQPVSLIVPTEFRGAPVICLDRLKAGENVIKYEAERVRSDGRRVQVSVTISALRGERGEVVGALSISRDVGERKELEEQLRQAQKLESMGRLAGGIAHDFNNCLSAIIGFSELMLREMEKGEYKRSRLEEIRRAAGRSRALTEQLMAFSRKQALMPKVVDLNSSIAKMQGMLRRLIEEDIDIQVKVDQGLGCIRADPGQIEQVILNLATNARDSMPGGGVLRIQTANVFLRGEYTAGGLSVPGGEFVVLAFSDTGEGMNEETRRRLFEPFYTTKEGCKGTGLGLATVYGIVKQSGGSIEVYSEPATGTTFKVYLPRVYEDVDELEEEPECGELACGSETILLVEDDDLVRAVERETLELAGYEVLEAASGAEALEISERYGVEIDLLITDVIMRQMCGSELAGLLRERRADLPVLFVSGYAGREVLDQWMVGPVACFVEKPFTPQKLARKVREILTVEDLARGGAGSSWVSMER